MTSHKLEHLEHHQNYAIIRIYVHYLLFLRSISINPHAFHLSKVTIRRICAIHQLLYGNTQEFISNFIDCFSWGVVNEIFNDFQIFIHISIYNGY